MEKGSHGTSIALSSLLVSVYGLNDKSTPTAMWVRNARSLPEAVRLPNWDK